MHAEQQICNSLLILHSLIRRPQKCELSITLHLCFTLAERALLAAYGRPSEQHGAYSANMETKALQGEPLR